MQIVKNSQYSLIEGKDAKSHLSVLEFEADFDKVKHEYKKVTEEY